MGWKCAPQVMGLVRGEPKAGQKHRANGRKIAMEAGYERASLSDTLDRTRSNQNEYEGYRSGKEFWDVMEQEASEYRVQVKGKTKTGEEIIREKGLQHNAVIGWAVIYNPPAEVCRDWTQAQYKKFHEDCQECMGLISPIFRKENIRMTAFHKDEGVPADDGEEPDGHFHDLGISLDENGHYCGTTIDAKLLVTINKKFPALMRERGWDMDDLDVTDFDRAKVDSDYKAERDFKRGQSGKSVNQHIRKTAEKLMDDAEAIHAEADNEKQEVLKLAKRSRKADQERLDILNHNRDVLNKQEKRIDESRRIIEESFRAMVRIMRGEGHEDDEIEVPEKNVSIADALRNEMDAWQERLVKEEQERERLAHERWEKERQALLDNMRSMVERIEKSADRDESRKRFMETHWIKSTGETFEEVYQRDIAKMHEYDAGLARQVEEMAGRKPEDETQKQ